ncbi:MAG: NADH-quinone oxidoreductase subunit J [Microthrixaceae bacterium]
MVGTQLVQQVTFVIAAMIAIAGAIGVIAFRNTVHNALSLVATLFGVAVLYVAQGAYFLAAIQVIVYAGAIVVLFLFVIMLLGVDRVEALAAERRPAVVAVGSALGASLAILVLVAVLARGATPTGARSVAAVVDEARDIGVLGSLLFTRYVFAFEITSLLLTIAVVGAVVLSRRPDGEPIDAGEFPGDDEPLDLGGMESE